MKKKRAAAAGLAVIMALTAAGCHQTSRLEPAETTVKESRKEQETTEEDAPAESESADTEEADNREPETLHPYIHTDSTSGYIDSEEGNAQISYSLKTGGLVLSDEEAAAYPKLRQALEAEYAALKKDTQEDLENLKTSAEEMAGYVQEDNNMQLTAVYTPLCPSGR